MSSAAPELGLRDPVARADDASPERGVKPRLHCRCRRRAMCAHTSIATRPTLRTPQCRSRPRCAAIAPVRIALLRETLSLLIEEIRLLEARIVGAGDRPADGDRDGRGDRRHGQSLPGRPPLRLLVQPESEGAFTGQYTASRPILKTGRPLPVHAAPAWRTLQAARGDRRATDPLALSMACANGHSPCSRPAITTPV
jgi:hypothetical protein